MTTEELETKKKTAIEKRRHARELRNTAQYASGNNFYNDARVDAEAAALEEESEFITEIAAFDISRTEY
jgi:hypothetical protein